MWSSSTTTRKVQGSSSNRRPFSRWVPGPKSSQRMRRMGFACILGAGDDLEDTKSVQLLIFRHCCITLQKCTYKGPSGTKSSFGVGTHLCTASALQLQHFDQCRDDNKHEKNEQTHPEPTSQVSTLGSYSFRPCGCTHRECSCRSPGLLRCSKARHRVFRLKLTTLWMSSPSWVWCQAPEACLASASFSIHVFT